MEAQGCGPLTCYKQQRQVWGRAKQGCQHRAEQSPEVSLRHCGCLWSVPRVHSIPCCSKLTLQMKAVSSEVLTAWGALDMYASGMGSTGHLTLAWGAPDMYDSEEYPEMALDDVLLQAVCKSLVQLCVSAAGRRI